MHWERFGQLTAIVIALEAARFTGEPLLGFTALVFLLLAGRLVNFVRGDGRRRHIALVRALSTDAVVRSWGPEPRKRNATHSRATPVQRGVLTAHEASEMFEYRRTPKAVREFTFWSSVALSASSLGALIIARVPPNERLWTWLIGLVFLYSVFVQLGLPASEGRKYCLTNTGIWQIEVDGKREVILWNEVTRFRARHWRGALEVRSSDGRRMEVGYQLLEFPRFVELLVSHRRRSVANVA
jgi:hypothetical protein